MARTAKVKRRKSASERLDAEIRLRMTNVDKRAFSKTAKDEGLTLSAWLRWVARRALKDAAA